ncbi:MAG TPA: hypothetical protein VGQ19_16585 [Burkholderiales bacterium]|nr:hypothetical protein [Burkholderiales bacterium]
METKYPRKAPRMIHPDDPEALSKIASVIDNLEKADRIETEEYHAAVTFRRKLKAWRASGQKGAGPDPFLVKRPAPRPAASIVEQRQPAQRQQPAVKTQWPTMSAAVSVRLGDEEWNVAIPREPIEIREQVCGEIANIAGYLSRIIGARPDSWPHQSARLELDHAINGLRLLQALTDKPGVEREFKGQPYVPRPQATVARWTA